MYSFSCNDPIRFVNGCPESKTLSLKYPHLQLLIQSFQFYMRSWYKLQKKNWQIPPVWEMSLSEVQVHRSYSQNFLFVEMYNCCLIFMNMSFSPLSIAIWSSLLPLPCCSFPSSPILTWKMTMYVKVYTFSKIFKQQVLLFK